MKFVSALALSAAAALMTPFVSASASVLTFSSDAAFNVYQNSGLFTKTFGGNVRWGNGLGNGDWEYSIVDTSDTPIGAVGQTPWTGTNLHDAAFSYDGAGNSTLSLSGIGSLTRAVPVDPTVLFARVRDSETPFSYLAQIDIDLAYNGVGVDYSHVLLTGDPDAEYWGVSDDNLRFGFSVTANANLDGPRTAGSDPMYQFKVGVPAPSSLAALGLGGVLAARRRRR